MTGLRKHIIMSLISDLALEFSECNQRFGINFRQDFDKELEALRPMETDGLLSIDGDGIRVNSRGRPFLRNICMPFDAYLPATEPLGRSSFSATV